MPVHRGDYLLGRPADAEGLLQGLTLPAVFSAAVERDPAAVAITDAFRSLTWRAWQAEVAAVARGLRGLGVRGGDVVAVQLPNRIEFQTAHLAVSAVGAVLLPVHMANSATDVLSLLRRTETVVAVLPGTGQGLDPAALHESVPGLSGVVLVPDAQEAPDHTGSGVLTWTRLAAADGAAGDPAARLDPDQPFVLLPSSGTTSARPKICVHSHDGLLSNTRAAALEDAAAFGAGALVASAQTHLFGLQAMYSALFTGARQILLPRWDAERMLDLAAATRPSVAFAVPTQLYDLVAMANWRRANGTGPRSFPGQVRTAGATLTPHLVDAVGEALGAEIQVVWGMSEIGYGTHTVFDDAPGVVAHSVGRPVPGSAARVVDAAGAPCAPGVTGQLEYRGAGMFRGYHGEPGLTAAAVHDGWLRTGDLAAVDERGTVLFRGRAAEMANVGGQKFLLTEVQGLLDRMPGIGRQAVVAVADPRLGEYPVLVVTPAAEGIDLAAVTAFLRDQGVAEYKLPLAIHRLPALPTTPAGKLDRRALGEALRPATEPDPRGRISERDALRLVAECVRTVCGDQDGSREVDPRATFRDLGVNSVGAIRLSTLLTEATGRDLAPSLAFDHPTPAAVAKLIARDLRAPDAPQPRTRDIAAVLDELERLVLAGAPDLAPATAARIRSLGHLLSPGPGPGTDVAAATDEELFRLIDQEEPVP